MNITFAEKQPQGLSPWFDGVKLPSGWEWTGDQGAEPTVRWPKHGLLGVFAHPVRYRRYTIYDRFQLWSERDGKLKDFLCCTENYDEFLTAFEKAMSIAESRTELLAAE